VQISTKHTTYHDGLLILYELMNLLRLWTLQMTFYRLRRLSTHFSVCPYFSVLYGVRHSILQYLFVEFTLLIVHLWPGSTRKERRKKV